eukprot:2564472-Pyramimonas_sp.AAC.2
MWSSPWGRETCEGRAEMGRWCHANFPTGGLGRAPNGPAKRVRGVPNGAVVPCELSDWGLGWNSIWGRETCEGCAEMGGDAGDDDGDDDDDDDGDGDDDDDAAADDDGGRRRRRRRMTRGRRKE